MAGSCEIMYSIKKIICGHDIEVVVSATASFNRRLCMADIICALASPWKYRSIFAIV